MSEAPPALGSLLAFYTSAGRNESDNILVRVAIAMRAHGRGGSLLVVPKKSDQWLASMVQPLRHSLIPDIGVVRVVFTEEYSARSPARRIAAVALNFIAARALRCLEKASYG